MTRTPENSSDAVERSNGFTPGPWHIGETHNDEYLGPPGETAIMAGDIAIAVALPTGSHGDLLPAVTRANARLISIAPDLLDVLQTSRRNIISLRDAGLLGPLEDWLRVVEAAIAKALSQ